MTKQRVPAQGAAIGERVWFALHCLPRQRNGQPPALYAVERRGGLSTGQLRKLVYGERGGLRDASVRKAAVALGASPEWLRDGTGEAPTPTGDVPPWPGRTT